MLEFDFCEAMEIIDFCEIEKRVNKCSQLDLERLYLINEDLLKSKFSYEVEEAKVYIELIEERMLSIESSELVVI